MLEEAREDNKENDVLNLRRKCGYYDFTSWLTLITEEVRGTHASVRLTHAFHHWRYMDLEFVAQVYGDIFFSLTPVPAHIQLLNLKKIKAMPVRFFLEMYARKLNHFRKHQWHPLCLHVTRSLIIKFRSLVNVQYQPQRPVGTRSNLYGHLQQQSI